jgi:hypothetical protein
MNDWRHRGKSGGGKENDWKQGELLRMTRLHGFLSYRGITASGACGEFPQLPTFRRGRDGIVSVYIIILLLSTKGFHAGIVTGVALFEALRQRHRMRNQ